MELVTRQRVLVAVYGGGALVGAAFGTVWWIHYGDPVLGGFFLVLAALSAATHRLVTQPLRRRAERDAERTATTSAPATTRGPTDPTGAEADPDGSDERPDLTGRITVARPDGYYVAVLRRYQIRVDGETVGAVKHGQSVSFTVTPGPHTVAARIDWSGSPEVTVHVPPGGAINLDVEPAGDAFAGMFSADKMLTLTVRR